MFKDLNIKCPFGNEVLCKPLEIFVGKKSHLPLNPGSNRQDFQNAHWRNGCPLLRDGKLHFVHQYLQKALVSLDSGSSGWVMGNYLYKKNHRDNVV